MLTPFGSRIHIPWAMAISARIRAAGGPEVETLWGDDGFVLRFPDTDEPPDPDWILVESAEAMQLVLRQLGSTALFAGRFRESRRTRAAAAAPPRRPALASVAAAQALLRSAERRFALSIVSVTARGLPRVPARRLRHAGADRDSARHRAAPACASTWWRRTSLRHLPASLLFSYVANFVYDGDAPLAERRAQALTIDQDQLRELLGEADLRELLDADAIAEVEETAQCLVEIASRPDSPTASTICCCAWAILSRDELTRACHPIRPCSNRLTACCARAACSNCASPVSAA